MDKLKDEAIKLNNDEDFVKYLPDEVEDRLLKNSLIQAGYEEGMEKGIKDGMKKGLKQGIEQGIEQNTIELTINMLKKEIDIKTISEITGLSLDEINKLSDNL